MTGKKTYAPNPKPTTQKKRPHGRTTAPKKGKK